MGAMQISEAASACGVPASTLRYYERIGLLTPQRSESGYRIYDEALRDRLAFVLAVKRLGLPLDQIRELLTVWDEQPCRTVKVRLRNLAEEQLALTRAQMAELQRVEQQLVDGLAQLDALTDSDARCAPDCAFLTSDRMV